MAKRQRLSEPPQLATGLFDRFTFDWIGAFKLHPWNQLDWQLLGAVKRIQNKGETGHTWRPQGQIGIHVSQVIVGTTLT